MRRIRQHLTYANVMATIAVFVALGGGAYALEGRNSVDSGDLKKNAVKSSDIAKNAIRAKHIKNGAVKGPKLANDAVGSAEVLDGSLRLRDLVVWTDVTSLGNGYSIGANACSTHTPSDAPAQAEPTDLVLVGYSSSNLPGPGFEVKMPLGMTPTGVLQRHQRVCNTTGSPLTFASATGAGAPGATVMGLRP